MAMFNPTQAIAESIPPAGTYVCRVTAIERGNAKSSGEGYLRLKIALLGTIKDDGTVMPALKVHNIEDILSFSPKATLRLGLCCLAVGKPDGFDLDDMTACRAVFLGRVFTAPLSHGEFNGQAQAKLGSYKAARADALAVYPHVALTDLGHGGGAPSGTGGGPGVGSEDDVPF